MIKIIPLGCLLKEFRLFKHYQNGCLNKDVLSLLFRSNSGTRIRTSLIVKQRRRNTDFAITVCLIVCVASKLPLWYGLHSSDSADAKYLSVLQGCSISGQYWNMQEETIKHAESSGALQ